MSQPAGTLNPTFCVRCTALQPPTAVVPEPPPVTKQLQALETFLVLYSQAEAMPLGRPVVAVTVLSVNVAQKVASWAAEDETAAAQASLSGLSQDKAPGRIRAATRRRDFMLGAYEAVCSKLKEQ